MPSNPRLRLLPGGPCVEIDGGSLYLGRDCILAIKVPALLDKKVSNRHLRIWLEAGRWLVEDLGSTNGTWLRGSRISARLELQPGDVIGMGRNGPQLAWEPADTAASPGAEQTMADAAPSLVATMLDDADGSDERPFKVGRTPEVALRHLGTGREYSAQGYTLVLGRDPEAAQILIRTDQERHVSGRHAEIQFRADGTVMLRDLGSTNGTWVNDIRVREEAPLKSGDRVVLGTAATTLLVAAIQS